MTKINYFLLLTSPPASGKTYWIKDFAKNFPDEVLVVSPLRALADECREKWKEAIAVMTPEEWLVKKPFYRIVIFDEFHLNFYWGDTFRPLLWEVFYELSEKAELVIALTATLSSEMKTELEHFQAHFSHCLWVDSGNQRLKFAPLRYVKISSREKMGRLLLSDNQKGVRLVFCQFRQEVARWTKKLEDKGYKVWSCVGGEAGEMRKKMTQDEVPDFIIATTVLSHGVNLPSISRIYFLYPLGNLDFWIQMVARGGRQGNPYEVFALENPHGIKWSQWSNYLAIFRLHLKMGWNSLLEQWDQCFLKDSSSTRSLTKKGI